MISMLREGLLLSVAGVLIVSCIVGCSNSTQAGKSGSDATETAKIEQPKGWGAETIENIQAGEGAAAGTTDQK